MLASPPVRTTRRRVLAVTAATGSAAVAASACEVVDGVPTPSPEPSGSVSGAAVPSPSPTQDADARLVADIAEDVADALALVTAAGRGRPALARALRGLARTHRAHLDELPTATLRQVRLEGDDQAALGRVRSAERRLQQQLADAAASAESGALAALLASMSAAVAQRLASEPLG